jgi:hypothetical protein
MDEWLRISLPRNLPLRCESIVSRIRNIVHLTRNRGVTGKFPKPKSGHSRNHLTSPFRVSKSERD